MYIKDGIAYADDDAQILRLTSVDFGSEYTIIVQFSNGECGIFDFSELLSFPVFQPLKNPDLFRAARIDDGVLTWDGDIDISTDKIYKESRKI
jgi:hypothetical protein